MAFGVSLAPVVRRASGGSEAAARAARPLLRAGVALLGLRIAVGDLAALGPDGLALGVGTVTVTLAGTVVMGRLLAVARDLTLLLGAGSAICGASAVVAVAGVTRSDEDCVGYALATVTLVGTVAMVLIPILGEHVLALDEHQTALWAGASIHEVAQVAGAAESLSVSALATATLVKLGRVVLLAPTVAALVALSRRERGDQARVPGFVVAFLAFVVVRSVAPLPEEVLSAAEIVTILLLAAGLAGIGLEVRLGRLRAAGLRPLLLGVASGLLAAATGLALTLAVS
jgi:uncharacterized integral membrane protein (TIGR00698 family)